MPNASGRHEFRGKHIPPATLSPMPMLRETLTATIEKGGHHRRLCFSYRFCLPHQQRYRQISGSMAAPRTDHRRRGTPRRIPDLSNDTLPDAFRQKTATGKPGAVMGGAGDRSLTDSRQHLRRQTNIRYRENRLHAG